MQVIRIGEEVHALVVLGMIRVVNEQPVDCYLFGHRAGVAEVVHAVVAHVDHVRLARVSASRNPAAVADDEIALPGASIVATKTDQCVAVQGGIFERQGAATDGVQSHMAEGAVADLIGAGDPHVCVHPGEGAVLEQDVLAEVRSDHAPARAVGDVVHSAVDHAEIHHVVRVIVIAAHVDRFSRRSDSRVDLVTSGKAVA